MNRLAQTRWRIIIAVASLLIGAALIWFLTTDSVTIWPIRNTLQYRLLVWWQGDIIPPKTDLSGALQGQVVDSRGNPIGDAWVLVALRDGTTYSTRSDDSGRYQIDGLPPGRYRPVSGAPGYEKVQLGGFLSDIHINANETTPLDITLSRTVAPTVALGRNLELGELMKLSCTQPLEAESLRREITFQNNGQPNQPAFYYAPTDAPADSQLPILFVIYPGPADTWECASIPLAAAGYIVLATGPAYSFDLESDVDELTRLLQFARDSRFPGGDSRHIAVIGGSYSCLFVQLLLERGQDVQAAMMLGPPTDLFDLRRRQEHETHVAPFGLDQAFIALGLPDQVPLRYWRYSGAYHVRADFPPLAVLHSRTDEIIPYQQSEFLIANLEHVGAPFEAHFFDGSSHYLLSDEADEVYQLTLNFLAKHLQPELE